MSGFFGTQANTANKVTGLQLQTAAYGTVLKVVYGRTRIAGVVGWYKNFRQTGTTNAKKGGK